MQHLFFVSDADNLNGLTSPQGCDIPYNLIEYNRCAWSSPTMSKSKRLLDKLIKSNCQMFKNPQKIDIIKRAAAVALTVEEMVPHI